MSLTTTNTTEKATVFRLEILINSKTNKISYNETILNGDTFISNGTVTVYDPFKERNVTLSCNNKDSIVRDDLKDKGYVRYSLLCTESRIQEFKLELYKHVRKYEDDLKTFHTEQASLKTDLVTELDKVLDILEPSEQIQ